MSHFTSRPARCFALRTTLVASLFAIASSTIVFGQQPGIELQPTAQLLVLNAKIWPGPSAKLSAPSEPDPTALAVLEGKFVAIGDDEKIRPMIGPGTKIINARGRRLIPGITDSHTHIIGGGFQLGQLELREVKSKQEFIDAVAKAAKDAKPGEWLRGGRWSVESWEKPETPTRHWLDPVSGDTPVLLSRMDGHSSLANSAALKLAGIDASGPADPKGGEIERDPKTHEPTGILKESAVDLVGKFAQERTAEQRYEALQRAMKHANSLGVTSVQDMSEWADIEVFRRAEQEKSLTVRLTSYLQIGDWTKPVPKDTPGVAGDKSVSFLDYVAGLGTGSAWFRVAGFKAYVDGSLGSRTAYMHEPFADATPDASHPRGMLTAIADPPESFQKLVTAADRQALQIAIHAIGDEGNRVSLDAYEAAQKANGKRDARHRVEHAQHLLVSDISRFASLGVVASMQPYHKADDGRYAEKAIGKDRLDGSYAYRRLVDAGALVVFGSDWPVVTMDPFAGIDSAVNARTLAGDVWLPSHSLTLAEAMYAYTAAPPKAIHRETSLGTIEVGKLADFVILRDDPFAVPAEKLGEIKAWRTIVGGKVVYTAPQ